MSISGDFSEPAGLVSLMAVRGLVSYIFEIRPAPSFVVPWRYVLPVDEQNFIP